MGKRDFKNTSKSQQSKDQSAARKAAQTARGSNGFKNGSNVHNGATISNSGQKGKRG